VPASVSDLAAFFEASPNPYLVLDRDLNIAAANRAYLASVNRKLADIVGRWAWDAFPTDEKTLKQAVDSFHRVLRTREPDTMALLRFDVPRSEEGGGGFEKRFWSITHTPVLDDAGEVAFVLQHPIDVTALETLRETINVGRSGADLLPEYSGIFDRAASVYAANQALTAEAERNASALATLAYERESLGRLFDQAPSFMALLVSPTHRVEFANPGYMALIGHRPIIGRTFAEALGDAVDQGYLDLLDQVYASGVAYNASGARYDVQPTFGGPVDERYVDFVLQPIRDRNGEVSGIFVQGVDVTERSQQDRRRDALERITTMIGDEQDPVDLAWRVGEIVADVLGASRVGYSEIEADSDMLVTQRDWTADSVASLAGRLSLRSFGSWIDDMKRGNHVAIADVRQDLRTADAAALEERHARSFVNIPVLEHGQLVAVFFVNMPVVHDWTDAEIAFIREAAERTRTATERLNVDAARRQAVDELQALNSTLEQRIDERSAVLLLYQNIVQSDIAPICAFDTDYRLIAFNQAHSDEFFRIYGYRVQIGDVFPDLFLPDQAPIMRGFMTRAVAGEVFTVTEEFGDPDLAVPYWEVSYNTLRSKDGRIIGAFHHAVDISERLRAQNELTVTQEALRQAQKMEAVGQLTGGLAHDFNNLLTGMMGNLELLQLRVARGRLDDVDRFIVAAQGAGRRAASLTQRLLAFSRRQTLDPKPTNVNRLVAGMEELLQRTVGPANMIEVVGAAGLWPANIDAGQLENALLNLCINARDAMPDGGRLTIETANKWLDQRAARERDIDPGQYLSICVTDTGTGMSPETIARAFEPFYTTKPLGEGTGLGLSMIYGFARQSGGQVRIYSEVGVGTTMCIYLPRYLGDEEVPESEEVIAAKAAASGETILVVDDEATIRHLIDEVLDEAGYTVIGAADGASGLKVLQSGARIELLITDVGLPNGMNGRQVADAARSLRPGLKVLFITGYAENAAVGNGHLEPGMELLTKPFTMEALSSKVADMMKRG
jgi:signal transduction histidine kinase